MAANVLTEAIPQLLAQGLLALRENCIMPQIVNREYQEMAGQRGSTIDVPIPSAIQAASVTPSYAFSANAAIQPTSVSISLDQWYEAAFHMSDKDLLEAQAGYLPKQASEAIKALANNVDQYILGLASKFYGYVGVGVNNGTTVTDEKTPFDSQEMYDATSCRTLLNKQLAPLEPRYMVLNPDAEGAALNCRPFHDASFGGGASAILQGNMNVKLGFRWLMDQNVQARTCGTITGDPDVSAAGASAGDTEVPIETDANDAVALLVGDIITFSGHSQQYVITTALTLAATETGDLVFQPPLVADVAADETFTVVPDHTMNIAFHRDAIAFATRPLASSNHPGALIQTAVDPVSGLALRLEVNRQFKQDRYSYDILYGAEVVRRELGVRLGGAV